MKNLKVLFSLLFIGLFAFTALSQDEGTTDAELLTPVDVTVDFAAVAVDAPVAVISTSLVTEYTDYTASTVTSDVDCVNDADFVTLDYGYFYPMDGLTAIRTELTKDKQYKII